MILFIGCLSKSQVCWEQQILFTDMCNSYHTVVTLALAVFIKHYHFLRYQWICIHKGLEMHFLSVFLMFPHKFTDINKLHLKTIVRTRFFFFFLLMLDFIIFFNFKLIILYKNIMLGFQFLLLFFFFKMQET